MKRAILALALLLTSLMSSGPAFAQGFSCSSFAAFSGNFSGVGVSVVQDVSISTFTFVAINNSGQIAVFTYGSTSRPNQAGVAGVTNFSTGTLQISSPATCLLIGSLAGDPDTFVMKVANGGNTLLLSTPFDSTEQSLGVFWRD